MDNIIIHTAFMKKEDDNWGRGPTKEGKFHEVISEGSVSNFTGPEIIILSKEDVAEMVAKGAQIKRTSLRVLFDVAKGVTKAVLSPARANCKNRNAAPTPTGL